MHASGPLLECHTMPEISAESVARAAALHRSAVLVDTHCDTTQRLLRPDFDFSARHDDGHVDIPRLREGGVAGLFLAVYAPGPVEAGKGIAAARAQIDCLHQTVRRHAASLSLARTAEDVHHAKQAGRIAILIGLEGGHLIEDSLEALAEFRGRGAAYLTLTHAFHTTWADSSGVHEDLAPLHGGLTSFGRDVIHEMNRLGMMVDVSHVSDHTFWDAVATSAAPIIASHSSCRAVALHRRNLSEEMLKAVAETGGVVQINFAAAFVDPHHPPFEAQALKRWQEGDGVFREPLTDYVTPLSVLVDHFDHALQLVGPNHVGIGSDFDGVPALPGGLEDCSKLPVLTAALLERGYTEADLSKVLGGNILRVMEECALTAEMS